MRQIDWAVHRAHREQIAEDCGQWVGLTDEDGVPLLTLPQLEGMDWPESRGSIESVKVTLPVRTPSGGVHQVVRELVAQQLGVVDEQARLVPVTGPARLLVLERPGMPRMAMKISHVEVEGDTHLPHSLTIHGVGVLGILDQLPCPSNPTTWTGVFTRFTRDWVGPPDKAVLFEHPRDLADMKLLTVADGASVEGDSDEVIHRLISESLQAVYRMAGITEHPPYVAVRLPALAASPYTILRPTDQSIWAEVGNEALLAGVSVRAGLWWPGDPQPPGLTGPPLVHPTIVFTVRQEV